MTGTHVDGARLVVGDRDVPLIAGEVQFWRMDPATWGPALAAARNAGFTMVSTYLSWRRHEPTRGQLDFEGLTDPRLDLRRFLRLCRDEGLLVQLKPGPWICAEEPGGGYPDWLLSQDELLALDWQKKPVVGYNPPFLHPVPSYGHPEYLRQVRNWFEAVWDVIRGDVHPAGPIVAVQLDNEPSVCFQDSMYGSDYSESAVAGFRDWLRTRYAWDEQEFRDSWVDPTVTFATAGPPLPPAGRDAESVAMSRRSDWIDWKGTSISTYLLTLRRMHEELGGENLLYTVNLITHPVHDTPVPHHTVRRVTGAMVGEDHYYVPPLDTADIHRLARSAATARAAGEPLPWIPELQAGIWRSPGEIVDYPEPTPLEQEIWWGAALTLGFAGLNLYMLVDRENWEHAPIANGGTPGTFFAPIERFRAVMEGAPGALTPAIDASIVVAWHRPDSSLAFSAVGAARQPDMPWTDASATSAYSAWDETLRQLTELGVIYDFWDTSTPYDQDVSRPLIVTDKSGVQPTLLDDLEKRGVKVIRLHSSDIEDLPGRLASQNVARPRLALDRSLVSLRAHDGQTFLHLVHWGRGAAEAPLSLDGIPSGSLQDVFDGSVVEVRDGRAILGVTAGHRVYRVLHSR